jgi:glycosyltransferase involved in cell wall biosynthesis
LTNKNIKSILFITQWHYNDALIQTYTLPYIRIIKQITGADCYLVCTDKSINRITVDEKSSIKVVALPANMGNQFMSWGKNIIALRKLINKKNITHLHAWCTPAGSVGIVLKLLNKKLKLTIDSYEPHAEAMAENGTWSRGGLKFKILSYMEKLEAKKANNLIFAAPGMQDYIYKKYKFQIGRYYVKPACVDLNMFSDKVVKDPELIKQLKLEGKIIGVYAGKFGGIYLEDESFQFIKKCQDYWGKDKFRFVLLSNVEDEYVKERTAKYGVSKETILKLFVPYADVAKYIGLADFAICPVKPVPTKRYCSPIKDGEYWALGLPVVITPNISTDSDIIKDNNAGAVIQSFDDTGYTEAIKQIDSIISVKSRAEVYTQIRPLAEKYRNFSIAEKIYTAIYAS